jgi:hypothetical protein
MGAMSRFYVAIALVALGSSCASSAPTGGGAASSGEAGSPGSPEAGATADTWANYAQGFFRMYCISCHNAQDPTGRDYSMQAIVLKDKAVMRCGVAAVQDPSWNCAPPPAPQARQFPIGTGPKPSDPERGRIVAWIDAGEP